MAKGMQFVAFTIAGERFAIPIESVREIVRFPEVTELPDAPHCLEGVINLRGRIVPVIDLRKRLKLPGGPDSKASRILITENGTNFTGLHVDSVTEVLKIPPDAIEAPPEMVAAVGAEYITGVAKTGESLIVLLDFRKLLSLEELRKIGEGVDSIQAA